MRRLIWFVLIVLAPTSAKAQLGISNIAELSAFPTRGEAQRMPQWCWAASLSAVFGYYDVDRTQEQIVLATYGRLVNLPAYDPLQLYRLLNAASFSRTGRVDVTVGSFGVGAPDTTFLVEELKHDHPLIVWYRGSMGGHAVVVFGVRYYTTAGGTVVTDTKYWDPWPGTGVRMVPAAALAQSMTQYFVVRAVRPRTDDSAAARGGRSAEASDNSDGKLATGADASFDDMLSLLISAAPGRFRSILGIPGRHIPEITATFYPSRVTVPGSSSCEVQVDHDRSNPPSVSCDFYRSRSGESAAEAQYRSLATLLSAYATQHGGSIQEKERDSTTGRSHKRETTYTSASAVEVRVRFDTTTYPSGKMYVVDLWVDSPGE